MPNLTINGQSYFADAPPDTPLLWVIREDLRLTGTKYGCGVGLCGSCTVHIDGQAVRSCSIPVGAVEGSMITTIEGLNPANAHPVQQAWIEHQVPQCGYCQSGQIMQAAALLSKNPNPTEQQIVDGMTGNLCRCATYSRIVGAVKRAAEIMNRAAETRMRERVMLRFTPSATTRREFLVRSAATAAGTFLSIGLPVLGSGTAKADAMSGFTPSIWFTLTPDGKVTMHIVKAEMGQHVGTGLAQVIAEELEVKWDDVRLDSPLESVENFAIYGLAYTVNSGSVTTEFDRLSRAGAAGRMALIEAGAKVLGAKEADCTAANSRVIDGVSGRSIGYGEIIQQVKIDRKFAYPDDFKAIKLKAPGTYSIIGKSIPALDIPAKTNGQAKYGIDVFLPNMVYGALVIPRTRYGSKVQSIDNSEARKIPGFIKAVKVDDSMGKCTGWVVAVAEKFPAAVKAAQALKVQVDPGPYGGLGSNDLFAEFAQKTKNPAAGSNWVLEGDVDKALAGAEKVLEMEYTTDMVCHATMEPLNATVQFVDGAWHVYSGTQSTSFARMTLTAYLSKVLGQKPEDIKIYVHESLLGGGFGGKQDYDEILAAAYCAKEVGRPVKLIQTRESTFATSFARTPTYHKLKAGLKKGQLVAMDHDICCGWMGAALLRRKEIRDRLAAA